MKRSNDKLTGIPSEELFKYGAIIVVLLCNYYILPWLPDYIENLVKFAIKKEYVNQFANFISGIILNYGKQSKKHNRRGV